VRFLPLALRIHELVAGVKPAGCAVSWACVPLSAEMVGAALASGNGVPVGNGLRRKRGVEVPPSFSPASDVCGVASGVDEIVGVGVAVGDKIGVSVTVGVALASGCGVIDSTGFCVGAVFAGVGVFPISSAGCCSLVRSFSVRCADTDIR